MELQVMFNMMVALYLVVKSHYQLYLLQVKQMLLHQHQGYVLLKAHLSVRSMMAQQQLLTIKL
jgi:hypothetical protein